MPRALYHFEACPACTQVRLALALEGLGFESFRVDPAERSPVRAVSGQEQVPVLVEEDGKVFVESTRILRHLAGRPGSKLLPGGRRDQALTWVLAAHADSALGPVVERLARHAAPRGSLLPEAERLSMERRLEEEVAALEGLLERGAFLFGDRPTVADLAVFSYLSRLRDAGVAIFPAGLHRAPAWYRSVEEAARLEPRS